MSSTTFDFPSDLSTFPKQTQDILRMAHELGWSIRWSGTSKRIASLHSPIEASKSITIPSTNLNGDRHRSTVRQIARYSDPDKVQDYVDAQTTVRKSSLRVALDLGPAPTPQPPRTTPTTAVASAMREAQQRQTSDTKVNRGSSERTDAMIGGEHRSGAACSSCGTHYSVCTRRLFAERNGRACCETCAETDTHDTEVVEKFVSRTRDTEVVAAAEGEPERTLVTEKPWMVRRGAGTGTKGRMYESATVIHRVWSDGSEDYRCVLCPYTNTNPRSVSGHYSKSADHDGQYPQLARPTHIVPNYEKTDITRPRSAIKRLQSDLLHALDRIKDWRDMDRSTLAEAVAEAVYEQRPDREAPEPLTPEQILARIVLMVDDGALATMHQKVEEMAAAMRENSDLTTAAQIRAERAEAAAERLREERQALAAMLSDMSDPS